MTDVSTEDIDHGQVEQKHFVRPPFQPLQDIKDGINFVVFNPRGNLIVGFLFLLIESIAMKVIINSVSFTDIDYEAYMEQIQMITKDGELDYSKIRGGTGPLVYPAGHVWLYRLMYTLTNGVEDVRNGQIAFRYLYLANLGLQFACYHMLEVPPWCSALACFSKRLHSIYVLRLFNDCFTTLFVTLTCTCFIICATKFANDVNRRYIGAIVGSIFYSMAVSIKMNAMLYLPGVLLSIYILNEGQLLRSLACVMIIIVWQVLVGYQFIFAEAVSYFQCAFNFGRQFTYQWSINWQFIPEAGFQSKIFHQTLLASHMVQIFTLVLSVYPNAIKDLCYSIVHPQFKTLQSQSSMNILEIVPYVLFVSNYVGILFSRSLHYQFLTWYHWTIPILMYWSKLPWYLGCMWYGIHEYCWNSYPPNSRASTLLFCLNISMLALVTIRKPIKCRDFDGRLTARIADKKKR